MDGGPERQPARDACGWLVAAVLALVLGGLSWLRHRGFWTGFDLAIFDQAAWQIAHGRTQISIVDRHVLADHLSPVLYAFGGLYRLAASPAWLLGVQAAAVGATVPAMRRVAATVGAPPATAAALTVASAPLLAAALFDFHPSTLAVPFLAWCLAFAVADRPGPAALAAVAAVACRADLALVVAAAALVGGRRTRPALLSVAAVATAAAAVVPSHFGQTNGWAPHFGHLGDSPLDALLHPWRIADHLVTSGSLWALAVWILAAGCVGLRDARWALALVLAGLPVLLSSWVGTELPWYHYGAPMAPIAIGGALASLGRLRAPTDPLRRLLIVGPALALLVASPLSPGAPEQNQVWHIWPGNDRDDLAALREAVPADASVSAEQWLLPHLSHREDLLLFPMPFAEPSGFFAPGSAPPLDAYDVDDVGVVIAEARWADAVPGFEVYERAGAWVILRPEASPR